MKLARPDIFHPRIVLAGPGDDATGDPDDAGLVPALRTRGLHARWRSWDDPETVRADLVILRATADDPDRRDEFLAWIRRVRHLLNPPDAVAWNLDEGYLRDLESDGIPTVLAGPPGRPVAQSALIFLGGKQSHAWPAEPEFEAWDLGYAALASAADRAGIAERELLYARADVAGDRLVGLDLVAPSLGWAHLDVTTRERAQREFALAVESACERLGLGPLSHRRP
ncbi:hypothetical protein [Mycobacterium nebraskense]|uniref:Glutathione synthase n=1 Tax=Mycobacterium nebraskense TaxID=244292 RepID=A0A0F5NF51_9MYCO|nr:hypothetical protein [Mycobacterium nebraskense]KKC04893.1 hypothetical protein WU83_11370 [Mycobacterium nebraskense]KLO37556.1 hypothetical protein ABW17_21545 [Mycobacterium nebraskense]MBI2696743.1 hypothetical protein [Mycobacterium nebraskense]MCV7115979.1 hypothetical protein [Mycobacterium nebraskense]ORW20305.1 hypothetical protein AWC17_08040 [Mycobacterium nebraskense]